MLGTGGLTTSDANQLVLSGKLSGTGGLTVAGTGQVTLGGANDYSGGTTVQTDATLLGDNGSLQGNIPTTAGYSSCSPAPAPMAVSCPVQAP